MLIGFVAFFSSCEKDETKVVMSDSPVAPSITSMPDLTLKREIGTNKVQFKGTPVNPGFKASATYYLEAAVAGTNFADALVITSAVQDSLFEMTVSDLNNALLKKFPENVVSSLDFRIRAVLVVDAGTGAPGTGSNPMVYNSEAKTANVTIYGLPRLDIIAGGVVVGKVESALGDGIYSGYVKLDKTKPFTLKDPDANVVYGGSGGALKADGAAIVPENNGYNKIEVNTKALNYASSFYSIGVVGAFTDWGTKPDIIMDYSTKNGWYTTVDLPTGPMKFRLNSAWGTNWGPDGDKDLPADGNISLPNSNGNINITKAGNYTIYVTITGSSASAKFILNK
jgi:hypothetical protein